MIDGMRFTIRAQHRDFKSHAEAVEEMKWLLSHGYLCALDFQDIPEQSEEDRLRHYASRLEADVQIAKGQILHLERCLAAAKSRKKRGA
jgi:ribulose bisphosphate carboxylase small subunit